MKSDGKSGDDYAHRVHDGTRRFAQDLLSENERLRKLAASLQSEKLLMEDKLLAMKEEQFRHERERHRLERELAEIEAENQKFAEQYLEVERQSSNLANLYVAAYQLHATLERDAVIGVIHEIIGNLVGSEQVAVFDVDPEGLVLQLAGANGVDSARYRTIPVGTGRIGRAAETGELFVAGEDGADPAASGEEELTACVPLVLDGAVVGVIAIFRLLPQKPGLEAIDHELFELLGTHAATALFSSGLRAKVGAAA